MMTNEEVIFFVRECAAHARTLTVPNAIIFLRGMIMTCPSSQAMAAIKGIYDRLMESDQQLDLIHTGQLKLDFDTPAKLDKRKKGEGEENGNGDGK